MNYVLDEARLQDHHATNFSESSVFALRHEFARNGFIKVRNIVDDDLREKITREVNSLIDRQLERRDLHLNTPRYMSVVRSEFIAQNSSLINTLSKSNVLLDTLSQIAGAQIVASVSKDEEYLITKQEHKGDTHGMMIRSIVCLIPCYPFTKPYWLSLSPLSLCSPAQALPRWHWRQAGRPMACGVRRVFLSESR